MPEARVQIDSQVRPASDVQDFEIRVMQVEIGGNQMLRWALCLLQRVAYATGGVSALPVLFQQHKRLGVLNSVEIFIYDPRKH